MGEVRLIWDSLAVFYLPYILLLAGLLYFDDWGVDPILLLGLWVMVMMMVMMVMMMMMMTLLYYYRFLEI